MTREIGSTFSYKKRKYKVCKAVKLCTDCDFLYSNECSVQSCIDVRGACMAFSREDGQSVIFKRIK